MFSCQVGQSQRVLQVGGNIMGANPSKEASELTQILRRLADHIEEYGTKQTLDLLRESLYCRRRSMSATDTGRPPAAMPLPAPPPSSKTEAASNRLIPLTKWNEYHEWPPPGGLRHLVFYADRNGFDKVIRRAGRRVLIDERLFFEWVEGQSGNQEAR